MIHHSPCAMKEYHPITDYPCTTIGLRKEGCYFKQRSFYISVVVVWAWTDMAENSDRWWALVNMVMNLM